MVLVPSRGPRDVYFHVGLFKSGTSYLQRILLESRDELAGAGVLVVGESREAQTAAVWDLTGRRSRGTSTPGVQGAWDRLLTSMLEWDGSTVVFSQENLVSVRPRQVRRIVEAFSADRFHVVVTVRDLARTIPSQWQQEVTSGATWSWPEYIAAVRDPGTTLAGVGVGFWMKQDPLRILDVWARDLPPDRVHVVVVPPSGSPPGELLERFCSATGIAVKAARTEETTNSSVSAAGMDVLLRLNARLDGSIDERQHVKVVGHTVRRALREIPGDGVRLPLGELAWVTERSEHTVESLRARGYDVVGPLEDLVPRGADTDGGIPATSTDEELVEAMLVALAAQSQAHARTWSRLRRDEARMESGNADRAGRQARAAGYRVRNKALSLANSVAVFGWLAARYHRRNDRSRRT